MNENMTDNQNSQYDEKKINKLLANENIQSIIFNSEKKSRELLNDTDKLEDFLNKLEIKLDKIPFVGNILADVPVLISMVRAYINGTYKEIPLGSIIAIISALIYVLSPVDLIPDIIPGVGYVDDAAVVAFVVKMITTDIEQYRVWRLSQQSISTTNN